MTSRIDAVWDIIKISLLGVGILSFLWWMGPTESAQQEERFGGVSFETVHERISCGHKYTTLDTEPPNIRATYSYITNISENEIENWYWEAIDRGYAKLDWNLLSADAVPTSKEVEYGVNLTYEQCRPVLLETVDPKVITNDTK